jgi:hypothetical protein
MGFNMGDVYGKLSIFGTLKGFLLASGPFTTSIVGSIESTISGNDFA